MLLFKSTPRRLFILGAVSACGFTPVVSNTGYRELWGKVELPEVTDDVSFAIRQTLVKYFGETQKAQFKLELEYNDSTKQLAITQNNEATRYRVVANGRFKAYRIGQSEPILDQSFKRIASYSANNNKFAADEAKRTAQKRLAQSLAEDFAVRFLAATNKQA